MTKKPIITEINFSPIKPTRGVIGYVSFVYKNDLYFGNIYVCTRPSGNGKTTYRLGYPKDNFNKSFFHPINRTTQETIERIVSDHIDQLIARADPGPQTEGETHGQ